MKEPEDVECSICGKYFGDGQAAWDEGVRHANDRHGITVED